MSSPAAGESPPGHFLWAIPAKTLETGLPGLSWFIYSVQGGGIPLTLKGH